MNRSIPFVLSLALIGPVALAEDAVKDEAVSQDAAAAQPDAAAAEQEDQAGASRDAGAGQDASSEASADVDANAETDDAQPAAGRQGQQQDPTQMFLKDQYSCNLYEIQLSQWVQQKAQDEQIKQFAQMLIKDHQQANQQLKRIAQSAGAQLEEKLDPVHQAKLKKFQQCPQSAVDRKFAFSQAAGHMMGVLELTYQSRNAQNQQVKQYATKMLPKMQQHLDQATQIATQLAGDRAGGDAQPAAARQPGESDPLQQQPQDNATDSQSPDRSGQDSADPSADQPDAGAASESGDTAGQSGQSDQPQ